jgi:hypothetical protein
LEQVLGVLALACEPDGRSIQGREVRLDERRESALPIVAHVT